MIQKSFSRVVKESSGGNPVKFFLLRGKWKSRKRKLLCQGKRDYEKPRNWHLTELRLKWREVKFGREKKLANWGSLLLHSLVISFESLKRWRKKEEDEVDLSWGDSPWSWFLRTSGNESWPRVDEGRTISWIHFHTSPIHLTYNPLLVGGGKI